MRESQDQNIQTTDSTNEPIKARVKYFESIITTLAKIPDRTKQGAEIMDDYAKQIDRFSDSEKQMLMECTDMKFLIRTMLNRGAALNQDQGLSIG